MIGEQNKGLGVRNAELQTQGATTFMVVVMLLVGSAYSDSYGQADTTESGGTLSGNGNAQSGEGWETLFDGSTESLQANWRGYRMPNVPDTWSANEGILAFSGQEPQGHHLISKEQYGDMVLELEWKISEGDNSGIFYLVTEGEPVPEYTGPEYQIVAGRTAGGNYDMHDPTTQVVKPAGEWNKARIVVQGKHVEHWLNDEKVVEYELGSEEWEQLKADSKFDGRPYGLFDRGHIVLQDHGNPAWFRNIRVQRRD